MIIERYILKNYFGPFIFSMSVLTFVFIMDFIIRFIDQFLSKGVAFLVVMQTFVLSLGHMFALIIPMAVLPATLMTFGNFAGENEITAMRATGLSLYRMILPGSLAALLLSIALVFYNNMVLPESNHKLMNLMIDINKKQPTMELQENRFIDDLKGYTIYFEEKDDRTGAIKDVQIFKHNKKGLPTSIVAERGRLSFMNAESILKLELFRGEIHELPGNKRDRSTYRKTRFESYTLHIRDVDRSLQRTERTYRGDREMSVSMMQAKIAQLQADVALSYIKVNEKATARVDRTFRLLDREYRRRLYSVADTSAAAAADPVRRGPVAARIAGGTRNNTPAKSRDEFVTRQEIETQLNRRTSYERQVDRYRVEIHKKYSIPFACLIFVLVGSPLAIRMGRSGMNTAIGLSILFFLVYYVFLIGGEKMADRGLVAPAVAMWAPNVIFGVLALFLLRKAAREQSSGMTLWTWTKQLFRRNAIPNPR